MYDVIVVGGGIIGCSVAYNIARRGQKVLLLERGDTASGTAGATDGFVGSYTKKPGPQLEMAIKSIAMFDTLEEELGFDIGFMPNEGGMQPVENEQQWDMLSKTVALQKEAGQNVDMISKEEARKIIPGLSEDIYGALYSPVASKVDPMALAFAYRKAAIGLGAVVHNESEVTGVVIENGRICGVKTESETYNADKVVNCCGAWAGKFGELAGLNFPIRPRKGQLAVTEPIGYYFSPTTQCARYNVIKFHPESITDPAVLKYGSSLNIGQTENGGLLLGGTRELVGFEDENEFEAIDTMLKRAVRFFPELKNLSIIRFFSGFRPFTADGMPMIGEVKAVKGYYIAAGHEGDGIALAPLTGKLMAELIVDGKTSHDLSPFDPNRFDLLKKEDQGSELN